MLVNLSSSLFHPPGASFVSPSGHRPNDPSLRKGLMMILKGLIIQQPYRLYWNVLWWHWKAGWSFNNSILTKYLSVAQLVSRCQLHPTPLEGFLHILSGVRTRAFLSLYLACFYEARLDWNYSWPHYSCPWWCRSTHPFPPTVTDYFILLPSWWG